MGFIALPYLETLADLQGHGKPATASILEPDRFVVEGLVDRGVYLGLDLLCALTYLRSERNGMPL